MKKLIKEIKDNNGLITMIDGLEYFWTQSVNRKLSSSQLRLLADELDKLNDNIESKSIIFDEATKSRFDSKWTLNPETGCHEWNANISPDGYGCFHYKSRRKRAHRISWEMTYGPIPKGLFVRHKCHNRVCVNPEHLELGTHKENMRDMVESGRSARGAKQHHTKLSEEQVIAIFHDTRMHKEIAKDYNIHRTRITSIKCGVTWGWLTKDLKVENS